jgi:hypothetical protein
MAKADAVLYDIYPSYVETGHDTQGHKCIQHTDNQKAIAQKASLLYGEISPDGLRHLLDQNHADIKKASYVFDLGMGTGKAVLQVFLEHPHLIGIYGVELSSARYKIAEHAVLSLINKAPSIFELMEFKENISLKVRNTTTNCILTISCDNLFNEKEYTKADIVIFDTDIPESEMIRLGRHFAKLKEGAKIVSYNFFEKWESCFPFLMQLNINKKEEDKFKTSWAKHGHKFYIWEKVTLLETDWEEYFEELEEYLKNENDEIVNRAWYDYDDFMDFY